MINDFRVAVATDLADLPDHQRRDVIAKLRQWKPRLASTQGLLVIGLTVRANGVSAAEKQARATVGDVLPSGKVTGVEVRASAGAAN